MTRRELFERHPRPWHCEYHEGQRRFVIADRNGDLVYGGSLQSLCEIINALPEEGRNEE